MPRIVPFIVIAQQDVDEDGEALSPPFARIAYLQVDEHGTPSKEQLQKAIERVPKSERSNVKVVPGHAFLEEMARWSPRVLSDLVRTYNNY